MLDIISDCVLAILALTAAELGRHHHLVVMVSG